MSKFDELLAEISAEQGATDALAKALPADEGEGDEKIADAAAEGGGQGAGEPDGDEKKPGVSDGDGDEAGMAKSFKVTLADGSEAEAVDATEMLKSLQDQVGSLSGKLTETEGTLAKALEQTLGLVKSQGGLIKSLSDQVKKLSTEGRGRKAVLTVQEPPLAKSLAAAGEEEDGIKPDELMAKAMTAQRAGKLMAFEVSQLETYLQKGMTPPAGLVAKAMS